MTCLKSRKAKAPHFLNEKGPKGSSKGVLRHFMTPWRAGPGCQCMRQNVALGKSPFCLWDSAPRLPNGKNQHIPFSQGLLELYIKEHKVSRDFGDGNYVSTQPEEETQRHFQTEIIQVIFVISNFKDTSSNILSAWEVEKHSSYPIQIHANSRQNFGLLN